jgi:hypothetical protein
MADGGGDGFETTAWTGGDDFCCGRGRLAGISLFSIGYLRGTPSRHLISAEAS